MVRLYGIWWHNRLRVRTRQVSEPSPNGRRCRKEARFTVRQKEEWVAVPLPYAGIPREVVDGARAEIKDNRVPSSAGRRFYEFSGVVLQCGIRVHSATTRSIRAHAGTFYHHHCHFRNHHRNDDAVCTKRKSFRAVKIEKEV
jgi:hypothetical protein